MRQLDLLGHWEHGFANTGDPETRRLGEPDGRLVLRSASRRFLQHLPPIHLAVSALSAVHDLSGKKKRDILYVRAAVYFENCIGVFNIFAQG